jgi:hypothetical protein
MRRIYDRRNTPYDLALTPSQKELYLGVLEKRVFAGMKKRLAFNDERRHPLPIVRIHLPGEPDERAGILWC